MGSTPTPKIWSGQGLPPGHPPAQLTMSIRLLYERKGGCSVSFGIPDDSPLLERYATRGEALAACRGIIVGDIDEFAREFADEQ